MSETSIDRLLTLYQNVKRKGLRLAEIYNAYYGKFDVDLSNNLYQTLTGTEREIAFAREILIKGGVSDPDIGFPWIALIAAAAAMPFVVLGGLNLAIYQTVPIANRYLSLREKELDAATTESLKAAYFMDKGTQLPDGPLDHAPAVATGFGAGAVVALLAVGYFLFSSGRARR